MPMKVVLRSATTSNGALCVMTSGAMLMLRLLADNWDSLDSVCCRGVKEIQSTVDLPTADAQALQRAAFGQGTGPIFLDNVGCTGNEFRLIDCPNNGIGSHNCIHSEDASVRCNQTRKYTQPIKVEKTYSDLLQFAATMAL